MIISSWNVNSIRARILNVQEYLKKFNPDIVLTQEIKTQEETYPFDDIKKLKYESYVFGQKSYNGVAILSKKKLDKIEKDIFKDKNKQSRIITADAKYKSKTIKIINIYTPNGNPVDTEKYDYKLYWLNSLIKKLNYESYVFGQKSYNGVAIISKKKLENVRTDLINDKLKQSRIISAEFIIKKRKIQIINIYTPNGNPVDTDKYTYKIKWLDDLIKQLKILAKKNENIILAGDFNIIPSAEDVYNAKSFEDDALYRLEIRKKLREIINMGYIDSYIHLNATKEGYTFWNYMRGAWQKNNGMRIDHFLISNSLINLLKGVKINKNPRGKTKPSDHTPIEIELA